MYQKLEETYESNKIIKLPTRVSIPSKLPLGSGRLLEMGVCIRKSILGRAFIGERRLKKRGRLLEKIRYSIIYNFIPTFILITTIISALARS